MIDLGSRIAAVCATRSGPEDQAAQGTCKKSNSLITRVVYPEMVISNEVSIKLVNFKIIGHRDPLGLHR